MENGDAGKRMSQALSKETNKVFLVSEFIVDPVEHEMRTLPGV